MKLGCLWMKKAGTSTGCWYSLACQPLMFFKDFTLHFNALNHRVSKLQPTSQIRLAKSFHPTRENILSLMKNILYLRKTCWFGEIQYIPKQSNYVRCPALELLCSILCGPQIKKFGDPVLNKQLQCVCLGRQQQAVACRSLGMPGATT